MRFRRLGTIISVTVLLLCNLAMVQVPVMADNEDPDAEGKIWGDWNITFTKTIKDQTVEVSGNITVMSGGTLILDNATLIMNSTPQEEWYITVNWGGGIQIVNGSVVTNNATFDRPYYFAVEYGGSTTIRDSTIRRLGNETIGQNFDLANIRKMGLYVMSNGVSVQDSTFEDNFMGVVCSNLLPIAPSFINTTFYNNTVGMAYTLACSPDMRLNTYQGNDAGLTILLKANAVVDRDGFYDNMVGIVTSLSTVSVRDSIFNDNTEAGIMAFSASTITVEDSSFVGNNNATYMDNSTLDMMDCLINGSGEWDFFLTNVSKANVLNTTIDDRDGIKVNDTESSFELSWYLDVKAEYMIGGPVSGAIVNMTTLQDSKVVNTATDANGWIITEEVVELVDEGNGPFYLTPHNLTAEKGAYYNLTIVEMNISKTIVLKLYERDLIIPDITIDVPETGAHVNASPVHVEGMAYDNDGLELVQVRLDLGNWTNATGLDPWSFDFDLPADGTYDICARAIDLSGNIGTECINVTLDRVTPSLTVTEPADGQYFNYSQLFVKGTTDADSLTINGEDVSVFANSFSHAITLPIEGANEIVAVATDLAGNSNTTALTVFKDLIPPSISVLSPIPFSTVNVTTVVVTGNVTDSVGIKDMVAGMDNSTWAPVDIDFTGGDNRTGAFTATMTLPEGESTVYLKANDLAGNAGDYQFNLTVDLPDVVPPEVEIVTPKDGDRIDGLTVTVTGTASDDEDVAFVEVNVGNVSFTPITTDSWATWKVNVSLVEGSNDITAKVTDAGANTAEDEVTVTAIRPVIDDETPTVTITTPKNNKVSDKKTIKVEGAAADNIGVKSVFVSIRPSGSTEEPEWVLAEFDAAMGAWSTEVSLEKGWNEITVKAVDTSMNNETTSILVKYDKGAESGDYTLFIVLILVIVVLMVVYVATLPGRKKARMAKDGRFPNEEEDEDGEEEE